MAVLQGIEHLEAKLKELELSIQRKMLTTSLKEAADITRTRAAELAPYLTGRLKEHEIVVTVPSQSNAQTALIRVGPAKDAFYGLFDEIGTAHMTAQPFLRPAFEQTHDEVLRKTAEDFKKAVEEFK